MKTSSRFERLGHTRHLAKSAAIARTKVRSGEFGTARDIVGPAPLSFIRFKVAGSRAGPPNPLVSIV
jgi:hypothetical protein